MPFGDHPKSCFFFLIEFLKILCLKLVTGVSFACVIIHPLYPIIENIFLELYKYLFIIIESL